MTLKVYSPAEERINIGSHALGLVLSVAALLLLVLRAQSYDNALYTLSFAVFGASLICLYLASTLYHSAKTQKARTRLRIVDHATIYILIAGTYTPFCLITLSGPTGWAVFAVSWGLATFGVVLKLFFTGRFQLLVWLIVGGLSYTTGALIYSIGKIPFNHAIFHLFVLAGSFCHFIAVYQYVYPT
jgi:hemolysin III